MTYLYLDTARLGQMTAGAQAAHRDFAMLVGKMGAGVSVEELLRSGYAACRNLLDQPYPGLESWQGLACFKQSLREQAGFLSRLPVLMACRSAVLMQFAATELVRRCNRVMTTDLTWPTYSEIFRAECRKQGKESVCVHLAEEVLHRGESEDWIVERLVDCYQDMQCDGLFLTSVSSLGGRLPITRIVERVRDRCRFVVVDGAQDYAHVAADVEDGVADLYLAGCHKWLGAYYPLGLMFFCREESCEILERAARERLLDCQDPLASDPLLQFVEDFQSGRRRVMGETVNLSNLFGVAGALRDAQRSGGVGSRLKVRQRNADVLVPLIERTGWDVRIPGERLRSGVMLIKPRGRVPSHLRQGEPIRREASRFGLGLSAYDRGLIRLSMPDYPLTDGQRGHIQRAFRELL